MKPLTTHPECPDCAAKASTADRIVSDLLPPNSSKDKESKSSAVASSTVKFSLFMWMSAYQCVYTFTFQNVKPCMTSQSIPIPPPGLNHLLASVHNHLDHLRRTAPYDRNLLQDLLG